MKFMVKWRVHPDKRQMALAAFAQMTAEDDKKDMGDNIRLIGRWHDMSDSSGVAICESDDPLAMANWALNWNSVLDLETSVVLNDEEARTVGRQRAAQAESMKTTVLHN